MEGRKIPDNLLSELLGKPTQSLASEVEAKIAESLNTLQEKLPQFDINSSIVVEYDLTGTTAGQAWGTHKIRLNLKLLNDPASRDHMLDVTIPHEVAHIVVHRIWGQGSNVRSHGRQWAYCMFLLGLKPNRTHDLVVEKARKHRYHTYYCRCGPKQLSQTRHNRIQRGTIYHCTNCGAKLQKEPYV